MSTLIERISAKISEFETAFTVGKVLDASLDIEELLGEALAELKRREWVSGVPDNGKLVIIHWVNSLNRKRVSIGSYCHHFKACAEHEEKAYEDPEIYDWVDDVPYRKEGWYEEPWESEHYYMIDGDVLGYLPLSALPPSPKESE